MTYHTFSRIDEESLIVVPCQLENDPVALAIDTGASHTTIDLTPLLMTGYEIANSKGIEKIETAGGVIDAYVFEVKKFSSLGIERYNFKV